MRALFLRPLTEGRGQNKDFERKVVLAPHRPEVKGKARDRKTQRVWHEALAVDVEVGECHLKRYKG